MWLRLPDKQRGKEEQVALYINFRDNDDDNGKICQKCSTSWMYGIYPARTIYL